MKKAFSIRLTHGATAVILLMSLFIWALCMLFTTLAAADVLLDNATEQYRYEFYTSAANAADRSENAAYSELPGTREYWLHNFAGTAFTGFQFGNRQPSLIAFTNIEVEQGCAIYDGAAKEPLSWTHDYLYFSYLDNDWSFDGFAVVILDSEDIAWAEGIDLGGTNLVRFTGVMENCYMTPYRVDTSRYSMVSTKQWDNLYDNGEELPEDAVTLIASPAYIQRGRARNSSDEMLKLIDEAVTTGYVYDETRLNRFTRVYQHMLPDPATGEYTLNFTMAVSFNPMEAAVRGLWRVYVLTFLLSMIWPVLTAVLTRRYLTMPLERINDNFDSGFRRTNLDPARRRLTEIRKLADNYDRINALREQDAEEIHRLNKALSYAEEAETRRREMSSNIAHELKTPLAVIHSYAEGLLEHIADDKREHYQQVILDETRRMDGMVLEMLDLSRLEAGRTKLTREDFSLTELCKNEITRLSPAAAVKELSITLTAEGDFPVHADPGRIAQVIANYLTNAIRHTPAGGAIELRLSHFGTRVRLELENEGEQIPETQMSRIWDSFYRVDEARHGAGTGLGLAIAKNIVELHGGRVSVRNTQRGVCFGFDI